MIRPSQVPLKISVAISASSAWQTGEAVLRFLAGTGVKAMTQRKRARRFSGGTLARRRRSLALFSVSGVFVDGAVAVVVAGITPERRNLRTSPPSPLRGERAGVRGSPAA